MSIKLGEISKSFSIGLALVEDAQKRQFIGEFLAATAPIVEKVASDQIQMFVSDINSQLNPHAKVELIFEGGNLMPKVTNLGDDIKSRRSYIEGRENISRFLVRMPAAVKQRASDAAHKAGISLNNWTVTVLERAVENLKENRTQVATPRGDDENKYDKG